MQILDTQGQGEVLAVNMADEQTLREMFDRLPLEMKRLAVRATVTYASVKRREAQR